MLNDAKNILHTISYNVFKFIFSALMYVTNQSKEKQKKITKEINKRTKLL